MSSNWLLSEQSVACNAVATSLCNPGIGCDALNEHSARSVIPDIELMDETSFTDQGKNQILQQDQFDFSKFSAPCKNGCKFGTCPLFWTHKLPPPPLKHDENCDLDCVSVLTVKNGKRVVPPPNFLFKCSCMQVYFDLLPEEFQKSAEMRVIYPIDKSISYTSNIISDSNLDHFFPHKIKDIACCMYLDEKTNTLKIRECDTACKHDSLYHSCFGNDFEFIRSKRLDTRIQALKREAQAYYENDERFLDRNQFKPLNARERRRERRRHLQTSFVAQGQYSLSSIVNVVDGLEPNPEEDIMDMMEDLFDEVEDLSLCFCHSISQAQLDFFRGLGYNDFQIQIQCYWLEHPDCDVNRAAFDEETNTWIDANIRKDEHMIMRYSLGLFCHDNHCSLNTTHYCDCDNHPLSAAILAEGLSRGMTPEQSSRLVYAMRHPYEVPHVSIQYTYVNEEMYDEEWHDAHHYLVDLYGCGFDEIHSCCNCHFIQFPLFAEMCKLGLDPYECMNYYKEYIHLPEVIPMREYMRNIIDTGIHEILVHVKSMQYCWNCDSLEHDVLECPNHYSYMASSHMNWLYYYRKEQRYTEEESDEEMERCLIDGIQEREPTSVRTQNWLLANAMDMLDASHYPRMDIQEESQDAFVRDTNMFLGPAPLAVCENDIDMASDNNSVEMVSDVSNMSISAQSEYSYTCEEYKSRGSIKFDPEMVKRHKIRCLRSHFRLDLRAVRMKIQDLRPGRQYVEIVKLCKDIPSHENFHNTIMTNTRTDSLFFLSTLKHLHMNIGFPDEHHWPRKFFKLEAQMFKGLADVAEHGITMKHELSDTTHETLRSCLNNTTVKVELGDSVVQQLSELQNKLKQTLGEASSSAMYQFLSFANKLFLFIASIWTRSSWMVVTSSFLALAGDHLSQLSGVLDILKDWFTRTQIEHAEDENVAQAGYFSKSHDNFLMAMAKTVYFSIKGFFVTLAVDEVDVLETRSDAVKGLASILKAGSTIVEIVMNLLSYMSTIVIDCVHATIGGLPSWLTPVTLQGLYNEFTEVRTIVERGELCKNGNAQKLMAFRKKLDSRLASLQNKRLSSISTLFFRQMQIFTEKWMALLPLYQINESTQDRARPVWIYLYGPPQIGKTQCLTKHLIYACAKKMGLIEGFEEYDNFVFTKEASDPFWEGYHQQPVVSFTDIFQVNDQQTNATLTSELTRMIDGNAYNLNMAFEGKGNTFYNSPLLITDAQDILSNVTSLQATTLSGGKHLSMRQSLTFEIKLNPAYMDADARLDCSRFPASTSDADMCPDDIYIITKRDASTGKAIRVYNSLKEFLKITSDEAANVYHCNVLFNEKVRASCRRLVGEEQFQQLAQEVEAKAEMFSGRSLPFSFRTVSDTSLFTTCVTSLDDVGPQSTKSNEELELSFVDSNHHFRSCKHSRKFADEWSFNDCSEESVIFDECSDADEHIDAVRQFTLYQQMSAWLRKGLFSKINNFVAKISETIMSSTKRVIEFIRSHKILTLLTTLAAVGGLYTFFNRQTDLLAQTWDPNKDKYYKTKTDKKMSRDALRGAKSARQNLAQNSSEDAQFNNFGRNLIDLTLMCGEHTWRNAALGITGNVIVVSRHFWRRCTQIPNATLRMSERALTAPGANTYTKIEIGGIEEYPIDNQCVFTHDFAFLKLPIGSRFKDISKKFKMYDQLADVYDGVLFGMRGEAHKCEDNCEKIGMVEIKPLTKVFFYGPTESPTTKYADKVNTFERSVGMQPATVELNGHYAYYGAETVSGDCGMILLERTPYSGLRILGIHAAGSGSNGPQVGIAGIITLEDVAEVVDYFHTVSTNCEYKFAPVQNSIRECVKESLDTPGCLIIEEKPVSVSLAKKTSISKSSMYEDMTSVFGPNMYLPAKLQNFRGPGGQMISPLCKSLEKMAVYTHTFEKEAVDTIIESISDHLVSCPSDALTNIISVWGDYEAVNGNEILNQLDERTSSGYPWCQKAQLTNKTPWLDIELTPNGKVLTMKEPMRNAVYQRIEQAKRGEFTPSIFIDALKDETRPIDKVLAGKTRLFQVGPMDLTIAMRKYFGSFIQHCHSIYLRGEIAIGINPECIEWETVYLRLNSKRGYWMCGDYTNFDASISSQFEDIIFRIVDRFYAHTQTNEDQLVRRILIASIFNRLHLVQNFAYFRYHGNPSGNCLTTIINCLANMFYHRYVYWKHVDMTLFGFTDNVQLYVYGDDCLAKVAQNIAEKYNMQIMQKTMHDLGITYTTADKDGEMPMFYDEKKITFLKRRFVRKPVAGMNRVVAVIDGTVSREICLWSQSDPNNSVDQMARMNQTLLFLALENRAEYERYHRYFHKWCVTNVSKGFEAQKLFTFEQIIGICYPETLEATRRADRPNSRGRVVFGMRPLSLDVEVSKLPNFRSVWKELSDRNYASNNNETIELFGQCEFKLLTNFDIVELSAQMDVSSTPNLIEQQQIAKFEDDEKEEHSKRPFRAKSQATSVSLDAFIERPLVLANFKWLTGNAYGTLLQTINFPNDFVNASDFLRNKMRHIAFWSPTFRVSVRINSVLTQYGEILVRVLPVPEMLSTAQIDFKTATHGEWYRIQASAGKTLEFDLPFTYFEDRIPVGTTNALPSIWRVHFYVLSPLLAATDTSCPPVAITVYGQVVEPNFSGFTNKELIAQSNYKNTAYLFEGESVPVSDYVPPERNVNSAPYKSYETGRPVRLSDYCYSAADFLSGFSVVRGIGVALKPLSMGVRSIGNILAYFGFSNPQMLLPVKEFVLRQPKINVVEDHNNAVTIGVRPDMSLSKDFSVVNGDINDLGLLQYASHPCLLYAGSILASNPAGQLLWSSYLDPMAMVYSDVNTTPSQLSFFVTRFYAISRFFRQWRGGFRIHIHFVASQFHSARVRLAYSPYPKDTPTTPSGDTFPAMSPTAIPYTETQHLIHKTVDIEGPTDTSCVIEYQQLTEWRDMFPDQSSSYDCSVHSNGAVYLHLVNPITSASTTISPIWYQIYVTPAADFEWSLPTMNMVNNTGVFVAQMEYTSSSSMAKVEYPPLGSSANGEKVKGVYTNAKINGLKQLLNMSIPMYVSQALTYSEGRVHVITPTGTLKGSVRFTFLGQILPLFAFRSGGLRAVVLTSSRDTKVLAQAKTTYRGTANNEMASSDIATSNFLQDYSGSQVSSGFHQFTFVNEQVCDIVLPWISKYRCVVNRLKDTTGLLGKEVAYMINVLDGSDYTTVLLSGADDLICGYPLPVPQMNMNHGSALRVLEIFKWASTYLYDIEFWNSSSFPTGYLTIAGYNSGFTSGLTQQPIINTANATVTYVGDTVSEYSFDGSLRIQRFGTSASVAFPAIRNSGSVITIWQTQGSANKEGIEFKLGNAYAGGFPFYGIWENAWRTTAAGTVTFGVKNTAGLQGIWCNAFSLFDLQNATFYSYVGNTITAKTEAVPIAFDSMNNWGGTTLNYSTLLDVIVTRTAKTATILQEFFYKYNELLASPAV